MWLLQINPNDIKDPDYNDLPSYSAYQTHYMDGFRKCQELVLSACKEVDENKKIRIVKPNSTVYLLLDDEFVNRYDFYKRDDTQETTVGQFLSGKVKK